MARSNKKRLNDDDESFGKSNKQPVLSVALNRSSRALVALVA